MIVSILFWLWELSLPVRGAWERGSSWGSTYTERERRHPKNNPPKRKFVAFSHFTRPLPFSHDKRRAARGAGGSGSAGGRRRAPGSPGRAGGGCRSALPRSAASEEVFPEGGSGGSPPAPRASPGGICKHLAGDGRPAGGRRQPPLRACCRAARSASAAAALILNSWAKKAGF